MKIEKEIIIYTDGACLGNPGQGGYAAVIKYGDKRKEITGGFRHTTNNRMELMAVIEALRALKTNKRYKVKIFSDSRLICDAINKNWLEKWKSKNWRRNLHDDVINKDLWIQLSELLNLNDVGFIWVKGHSDNKENNRCDFLSKEAASRKNLPYDTAYESSIEDKGESLYAEKVIKEFNIAKDSDLTIQLIDTSEGNQYIKIIQEKNEKKSVKFKMELVKEVKKSLEKILVK